MVGIAVVLLSGGMDSTTCLHHAVDQMMKGVYEEVHALSINYGQRHKKEIDFAKKSCEMLNVQFHVQEIAGVFPKTMLTSPEVDLPNKSYDEIEGVSPTYVPYRNGTLLSVATAFTVGKSEAWEAARASNLKTDIQHQWDTADGRIEHALFYGAHAEDAANWAYPRH